MIPRLAGGRALLIMVVVGCAAPAQRSAPATMEPGTSEIVLQTSGGTPLRLTVDRDPSRHRVSAPLSRSWSELAKVYDALAIPLEYADHRSNRAGNTRFVASRMLAGRPVSTFLRCGFGAAGPLADSHRVRMSIATELKSVAQDSTAVFTQIEATASPVDGTNTAPITCTSTGALEMAIVTLLKQQVGEVYRRPRD
ncbi:MAG: hypothetical protein ACRENP_18930 [Longimicrobiales bacterium]